jgi:hypothetical protein
MPEIELDTAALCIDCIIETIFPVSLASIAPAADNTEVLNCIKELSHKWRDSALGRATSTPGTIVPTLKTIATMPVIAALAPGTVVQATDLTSGMALQPQSVGTITALGPVLKSVPSLAPTTIRKTRAADVNGGTRLH